MIVKKYRSKKSGKDDRGRGVRNRRKERTEEQMSDTLAAEATRVAKKIIIAATSCDEISQEVREFGRFPWSR